jgi:hypothetical protein
MPEGQGPFRDRLNRIACGFQSSHTRAFGLISDRTQSPATVYILLAGHDSFLWSVTQILLNTHTNN